MSLTVGELQVLLSGDPSQLNRELDRLDARAGQTEKAHTAAWSRIGAVAGTALKAGALLATAATVGVGVALRSTVQIGMEYQDQLNTLGVVSGATAQQMTQVASVAKELGGDLTLPATSAADAAAAMTELAKGGLNVDQAMLAAKGTLQLAAAAQLDAASAAQIQSSALNQFGLSADQASRVADVLAATANAAAGELTDVALALSYVGPVANTMGVSIEEASAAIGVLANNGLIGEKAGTSLRAVMASLAAPSKLAAGALEDLGIQAFDASGNFVGFSAVAGQLSDAQGRLSTEAFSSAAAIAFGNESLGAVNVLASEGAAGLDAMTAAAGRQGAATDLAAAKAKGLRGAFEGLQSQVETLKIQGFEALSPAMESVVRKASDLVPVLGQHLFSAIEKAIGAGRELHETYGPQMAELGEIAAQKWGQFTDLLGELGSAVAPSLPSLIDSLVRIAKVGGEVGEAMLPALSAGLKLAGPAAEVLSGALTAVASVLEMIEPILPVVIGGIMAFKAVAGIMAVGAVATGAFSRSLGVLAAQAQIATMALTGSMAAGAAAGTALLGIGRALPVVGLAAIGVGMAMQRSQGQIDDWAQALLDGGAAAETARQQMGDPSFWDKFTFNLTHWGNTEDVAARQTREATKAAREQFAAMNPLQQAQQKVAEWTNTLNDRLGDENATSAEVEAAKRRLAYWAGEEARQQGLMAGATQTATDKLIAQAQQAMAAASADLALRQSRLGVEEAQARYNEVMADGTTTAEQRTAAEQALEGSYYSAAQAAAAKATADSAGKTPAEQSAASVAAQLQVLEEMAAAAGGAVPAGIAQLIASLKAGGAATLQSTAQTEAMTTAVSGLGLSVQAVPGQKFVQIDAPTAAQQKQIEDLGYKVVNLPNGDVYVVADTADAEAALNFAARKRQAFVEMVALQTNRPMTGAFAATGGGIEGGRLQHFDIGGAVRGPGGPTSDLVPAMLSNGEHVWTAREVDAAGGQAAVARLRRAVLAGVRAGGQFLPGVGAASAAAGRSGNHAAAGTASASVGGVTEKHYHMHAAVTHTISLREFMALKREADALYG